MQAVDRRAYGEHAGQRGQRADPGLDQVPGAEYLRHPARAAAGETARAQVDHRAGSDEQRDPVAGADRRKRLSSGSRCGFPGCGRHR
jgi:hypothetical protein